MRLSFFSSCLKNSRLVLGGALLVLPLISVSNTTMPIFDANSQKNPTDLEARNSQGQTPLMAAIYQGNTELALWLIQAGANVNAQDDMANSPFLYAGAEGMLNIVKAALNHGADFSVLNRYGGTALIPAAEKGHLDVVKLLASTPNYPINHVNRLGWTALMEAVVLGNGDHTQTQIVEALLQAGADPSILDKDGVSVLEHAQQRGFDSIVNLLKN